MRASQLDTRTSTMERVQVTPGGDDTILRCVKVVTVIMKSLLLWLDITESLHAGFHSLRDVIRRAVPGGRTRTEIASDTGCQKKKSDLSSVSVSPQRDFSLLRHDYTWRAACAFVGQCHGTGICHTRWKRACLFVPNGQYLLVWTIIRLTFVFTEHGVGQTASTDHFAFHLASV